MLPHRATLGNVVLSDSAIQTLGEGKPAKSGGRRRVFGRMVNFRVRRDASGIKVSEPVEKGTDRPVSRRKIGAEDLKGMGIEIQRAIKARGGFGVDERARGEAGVF
jgi:hypothetical protein